jgi:hypothetical protein
MEKPKRLFRFYGPNKVNEILDRQLVLASPEFFNDPFDCTPSCEEMISEGLKNVERDHFAFTDPTKDLSAQKFRKYKDALREECRELWPAFLRKKLGDFCAIACFFGNDDPSGCVGVESLLLWAHYAQGNKGFAVEFNPEHSIFGSNQFEKVIYSKRRPEYRLEEVREYLLTKSPEWATENEYRLLIECPGNLQKNNCNRYYIPLERTGVKAIYLGCESDKPLELRRQLVTAGQNWNVPVYVMRRHPSEFSLVPIRYEQVKPSPKAALDLLKVWRDNSIERRSHGDKLKTAAQ